MEDFSYAYLLIAGIYFILSLGGFILFKKIRLPMLVISVVLISAGPISEFFSIPEYWNPWFVAGLTIETPLRIWRLGIEDVICTVGFAGLSLTIFELIHGKPMIVENKWHWKPSIRIGLLGLAGLIFVITYFYLFRIPGIHACNLSMLTVSVLLLIARPEYLRTAIITAIISAFIYWLVLQCIIHPLFPGIFHHMWNPEGRMGIMVPDMPLEEILWAFSGALFAGPVYRITHESKMNSSTQSLAVNLTEGNPLIVKGTR